ncbi:hypothetical protein AAG906_029202 [Vitis piasezkii]
MAEQIPFSVVENVLSSLGSSVVQKIGSVYGVRRELTKLEETLGTLKAVLLDAEDHLEKSHAVKDWVKRLKGVVYDVDDLLDDFATYRLQRGGLVRQVSHFFSSSNQVAFRFQMSGRVDDIKEALDEIKRYLSNIGRETHSSPHSSNLNPRNAEKEGLVKLLVSPDKENVFIVAIVGIGGLGKTTLAQLVYDDERVQKHFEFKKWVCVSDDSGSEILVLRSYVNNIPKKLVLPNAITRLKNLQTLKLIWCRSLKRIPDNIGELINLRHLENDSCFNLAHMPHGIGKLTLLNELKGLNQLRGGLCISNLQNVRDVELVSRGEILKGKQYLQSLRLEWKRWGQDGGYEGDKSVMEGLQPHPHLKDIFIAGYGGTEFPTWMMNDGLGSLFPYLIKIEISGCSRCKILPPFSQLPSLKSLKLHDMKEAVELKEGSLTTPLFPSLESLELSDMPKLKELWRMDLLAEEGPSFSCLSKLYIHECSGLASLHSSPSLSQLNITDCHNLASLELHSSPSLSQLIITDCHNLASLASLELHSSPSLSQLNITDCHNLASLELHSYPSLSQLEITNCHNLASLELHSSPSLSQLRINDCPNLTSMELPSSLCLSELYIRKCPNLASFKVAPLPSLETLSLFTVRYGVIWQIMSVSASSSSLKSLYIESIDDMISLPKELLQHVSGLVTLQICECPNLQSLELPSSHCLSKLKIINCPNLASFNVASLPRLEELSLGGVRAEVLRQLMFVSASSSLKSLRIWEIDGMISLPEEPLQHVSGLVTLQIRECPNLQSFELPSSHCLSKLKIIKCPNLASFNVASLPRLEELSLRGVRAEVLRQLMFVSASSSLKSLRICEIDGMISLPEEPLQYVSTLETLYIVKCSGLATLLHWMGSLSSLTELIIDDCSELTSLPEEETGKDRAKIAHIPHVRFNIGFYMRLEFEEILRSGMITLNLKCCFVFGILLHLIDTLTSLTELEFMICSSKPADT